MSFEPVLSVEEVGAFLRREFPQVSDDYEVVSFASMRGQVRIQPSERNLRPGGTISGPAMFSLADCAVYLTIIEHVGPEALAVTTNASIDFMRKPEAGEPLIADVELLKLGRGLAVGDVRVLSGDVLVARATLTYSRPRSFTPR